MEIGIYMDTHGVGIRGREGMVAGIHSRRRDAPGRVRQLAESGYHSLWFPDHVTLPLRTTNVHSPTGRRHYPEKLDMLDAQVTMGAVAAATTTIKLATSVLIAPYRPPLSDARQFATNDLLSNGRVIAGVGGGWALEEFQALDLPYEKRSKMAEECIEIYKRSWTETSSLSTGSSTTSTVSPRIPSPCSSRTRRSCWAP